MRIENGLVLVSPIDGPEFVSCCSTREGFRETNETTRLSETQLKERLKYLYDPAVKRFEIWYCDFQGIFPEFTNIEENNMYKEHKGVVIGEVDVDSRKYYLVVPMTSKKHRPTGVPLWKETKTSSIEDQVDDGFTVVRKSGGRPKEQVVVTHANCCTKQTFARTPQVTLLSADDGFFQFVDVIDEIEYRTAIKDDLMMLLLA